MKTLLARLADWWMSTIPPLGLMAALAQDNRNGYDDEEENP